MKYALIIERWNGDRFYYASFNRLAEAMNEGEELCETFNYNSFDIAEILEKEEYQNDTSDKYD